MKRIKAMVMIACLALAFVLVSCAKRMETSLEFDINSLKRLSNLAVCECKFNHVAKFNIPKGEGIAHLGEKDRKVFMEYEGTIKIGVDINEIISNYDAENRVITIPKAKIISISDNPYSYTNYISKDSIVNRNTIDENEFKKAISSSLQKMESMVRNNNSLMNKAQVLAESQIKAFISTLGDFDIKYVRE